jgi:hypothetical protein
LFLIRSRGTDDNPTHVVTSDAALAINVVAWFASCVSIIYWNEIIQLIG